MKAKRRVKELQNESSCIIGMIREAKMKVLLMKRRLHDDSVSEEEVDQFCGRIKRDLTTYRIRSREIHQELYERGVVSNFPPLASE